MIEAQKILNDINTLEEVITCWYSEKIIEIALSGDDEKSIFSTVAQKGIYPYSFYIELLERKIELKWNEVLPGNKNNPLFLESNKGSLARDIEHLNELKALNPKPKYINTKGDKPATRQQVGQAYIETRTGKTIEQLKERLVELKEEQEKEKWYKEQAEELAEKRQRSKFKLW